ncbi:unnamed protein product [Amaranthus hypochondriacus]
MAKPPPQRNRKQTQDPRITIRGDHHPVAKTPPSKKPHNRTLTRNRKHQIETRNLDTRRRCRSETKHQRKKHETATPPPERPPTSKLTTG